MSDVRRKATKVLVCYLVLAICAIGFVQRAHAGLTPSELINLPVTTRTADLEKIQKILEVKMVGERLNQLGLTQEEIQGKLGQLNDQQVHQLAVELDQLKIGGFHGAIILIAVVAIAAIVLLVFLHPW
jgi:hypothetical protein